MHLGIMKKTYIYVSIKSQISEKYRKEEGKTGLPLFLLGNFSSKIRDKLSTGVLRNIFKRIKAIFAKEINH